jgi:hypothetical protein
MLIAAQYHTQTSNSSFDTPTGRKITGGLNDLAARFDLASLFGTAPQDYTLNRYARRPPGARTFF